MAWAGASWTRSKRKRAGAGLTELWATARAPGFFVAMGYSVVADGRERDLLLSECFTCGQYGKECQPQAVRRMFVPQPPRRRANDEPRRL